MADKTLIKNGIVLTLDKKIGHFHRANVLIEGAKIEAVGGTLKVTSPAGGGTTLLIEIPV